MIDVILLSTISAVWATNVSVNSRLIPERFSEEVARDRHLRTGLKLGEYIPIGLAVPLFIGAFSHLNGWVVVLSFLAGQIVGVFFGALRVARGIRRSGIGAGSVRNTSWALDGVAMVAAAITVYRFW